MTDFEQYFTSILDGKIAACEKMKRISEQLLNDFNDPGEYHFDHEIAERHVKFIETFCKLPSGDIGKPLKLETFQKARLQALFGFVDDGGARRYNECLIIEGRKNGKALSLDTDIPTTTGFKKIADINVGDFVFGDDGKPHKVICVSDVFTNHDCYAVTLRGAGTIIADAEHLWRSKSKHNVVKDRTTKQLAKHFMRPRADGKGIEYLWRIPLTAPVEYQEAVLPLDPYTLGVWLGDGTNDAPHITVSEEDLPETVKNLEACGHTVTVHRYKDRAPRLTLDSVGKGKHNKTLDALRELHVLKNKHIPDIYLHASVEQRVELLRGLMDTDGYVDAHGRQCEFSQKNERMVDQFRELLASLGVLSSKREKTIMCNGKECHAFNILFFMSRKNTCFKLKRKATRLKEHLADRMSWASIIDIKPVPSVPCKCIAIDSKNHLYLASRFYTVTHNTTETAAVELDLLMNDREGAPQIYNVATALDQAKLGFNAAYKMVQQSPLLRKHIRKRAADLYCARNFGFIKAIASNSNTMDGLDVHGAVIDELAAIKNRDIYDLIKQAMGARRQPLLFCITTSGFVRESIYDAQYEYASNVINGVVQDKHFLPFIYELDDPAEWQDETKWIKANPGLGTIKSVDYLRQMVEKGKADPSFKPTVLVKDFNVKQSEASAWLTFEAVVNETVVELKTLEHSYAIGGCDLSSTTDLTCATLLIRKPGDENIYVLQHYFIPEKKLNDVEATQSQEAPYKLWREQGWLTACEGAQVDYHAVTEWFAGMVEKHDIRPLWVCYDRALSGYWVPEMEECGFDMEKTAQGPFTWSQPMKEMGAAFTEHKVVYNNNPILRWCLLNTAVKSNNKDGIETIQPIKIQQHRRIDGMVSLLNAWVGYVKHFNEYMPYVR